MDIPDYEGLYKVSNRGRVKNNKGEELKQNLCDKKYFHVWLYKNRKRKMFTVHKLVAKCFVSNPNGYQYVNHIDENKRNNDSSNLEWCTAKYNVNYGSCISRRAESHKKPIIQLTKDGEYIKLWNSAIDASNSLGICSSTITAVAKKRQNRKTAGGYMWKYKIQK